MSALPASFLPHDASAPAPVLAPVLALCDLAPQVRALSLIHI